MAKQAGDSTGVASGTHKWADVDGFSQRYFGDIPDDPQRLELENAALPTAGELREEIFDMKAELIAIDSERTKGLVATKLVQRRHELYMLVCSNVSDP